MIFECKKIQRGIVAVRAVFGDCILFLWGFVLGRIDSCERTGDNVNLCLKFIVMIGVRSFNLLIFGVGFRRDFLAKFTAVVLIEQVWRVLRIRFFFLGVD